jgi:hypothetical protein
MIRYDRLCMRDLQELQAQLAVNIRKDTYAVQYIAYFPMRAKVERRVQLNRKSLSRITDELRTRKIMQATVMANLTSDHPAYRRPRHRYWNWPPHKWPLTRITGLPKGVTRMPPS